VLKFHQLEPGEYVTRKKLVKTSCCLSAIFAALLLSPHELPAAEPPNINADGMAMAEVAGTEAGRAVDWINTTRGWEIGTGPSVVIVDKGMARSFTTSMMHSAGSTLSLSTSKV